VSRKTVAVDFDGVLRDPDNQPLAGARNGVRQLARSYRLVVFTTRKDLEWVRGWLAEHGLGRFFADVTNLKPNAVVYLDDRAVRFDRWEGTFAQVRGAAR
jgi:hypothetical protein